VKKKLVHIISELKRGGAESLLVELAVLCSDKYDVTVISQYKDKDADMDKTLRENNVNTIYLDKKNGFDIKALLDLKKELEKINPDIIHTHLQAAIYAVPYYITSKNVRVHTIHSVPNMEFPKVHRVIQKFAYKYLNVIPVAISNIIRDEAVTEYSLSKEKIKLIYNGINTKKFSIDHKEDSFFRIINVASLSEWKNQIFLLNSFFKAFKDSDDVKLTFVGDGVLRKTLEDRARELGLGSDRVCFAGITSQVEEFLSKSDLFVLSSLYEGIPLTVLEAYSAGLPVVATNVGGIPDIVTDGENGILVELNNEEKLSSALIKLKNDKKLYEEMSKANKEKAKNFDISVIGNKYIQLYEQGEVNG